MDGAIAANIAFFLLQGTGAEEVIDPTLGVVAGLGLLVLVVTIFMGDKIRARQPQQASRPDMPQPSPSEAGNYLTIVMGFSRNAKLFLARSLLTPLGFGIWGVIFNLYLLGQGFQPDFIAQMVAINWLFHGAMAFPAGLISDRYGRRITFLLANAFAITMNASKIFTLDPGALLLLSGLSGVGEGFHAVTGAPFMMENSEPRERVHLFSLQQVFFRVSNMLGALSGGFLPFLFYGTITKSSAVASQSALVVAIPLMAAGLIPIYLIREKWVTDELRPELNPLTWLRNITSWNIVAMLVLTSTFEGLAIGFYQPFFNVFFKETFNVNEAYVGTIFAWGGVAAVISMLFTPFLVPKLGRVRTIVLTEVVSLPFLVSVAAAPTLSIAIAAYLLRGSAAAMAMPIANLFSMELVQQRERGTTAGLTHAASEMPMALTAAIAGGWMAQGSYLPPYVGAAALYAVSFALFFWYFRRVEDRQVAAARAIG